MFGDGTPAAPIASAAMVLLRDGAAGVEVLLIQRHQLSDVLGGAYTFPGGKVDRTDLDEAPALDVQAGALHRALGEDALTPALAAAIHVAAMRELQEEAGISGLQVSQLVPWARWITPAASRRMLRHFDARFFVARLPVGQQAAHDQHEAVASAWFTPADALRKFEAGRMQLAPPQLMSLLELAAYRSADDVVAAGRGRAPLHIQPVAAHEDGQDLICFPGDAHHPVALRRLPGPSRLFWRGGRFRFDAPLDRLLPAHRI
jgi:8-oxo-dGTP pyrophosphatase MutT (NUDIX family)